LRVDETYINVKGEWAYLDRAVDNYGNIIDFYLSRTRNSKAAKLFLTKALKSVPKYAHPSSINTDKNPTYNIALNQLKEEGKCSPNLEN
jgi:transposase-like protein